MAYPDGMQFRSSDTRSPYYRAKAMSNYQAAVSQDAEIAEEIRELITRTEQQVNAKLSRVTDRGAFDTDELDCLFCRLGEALPNRAVLEQRAG
ncbi:hypothetical protein [Asaia krungthepensis]|uniref:Uncharacterized protein n=1 Tax=Asaia krungthepensis NRIC 0535 TaxID=1307925 RepID=A0ABQ0Q358_9PROT|nr:hypothetical protein [Asaia krungthepensis]GBQ89103.1 hypothetical protein AA0535_1712 [Asaia krungthepensis NRIC 0535]